MGLFQVTNNENTKAELEKQIKSLEEKAKKQEIAEAEFNQMVEAMDNSVNFLEMQNMITEEDADRYKEQVQKATEVYKQSHEEYLEKSVDERQMTMSQVMELIAQRRQYDAQKTEQEKSAGRPKEEDKEHTY